MTERNLASAEAYYKAMSHKDLSGMAQYLHPDVQFLGPLAELKGKEIVLEAVGRLFPLFKTLSIRSKFGTENQTMMVYDLDCLAPIGLLRVAALLTFKDKLVSRIELFLMLGLLKGKRRRHPLRSKSPQEMANSSSKEKNLNASLRN